MRRDRTAASRSPRPAGWAELAAISLFATALYVHLFGAATLDVRNVAWLLHGDPAQHYLGWAFFRNEPWQWPPGRIERFGLPGGASIAFTDAIPLLAFAFKPFSALLPADFQYFGPWILACYVLNGVFGLRLMARLTERRVLRVAGAAFFVLSPPLLLRGYGHESLMAHWLLLAAIETGLDRWSGRKWLALSVLAALCHPYLLLMVLALSAAAAFVALRIDRSHGLTALLGHAALVAAAVAAPMALAGYFGSTGGLSAEGYGFYSMNVLSLFDPLLGWSRFIQQRPIHPDYAGFGNFGQYEGFLYLGAGMIALGCVALGATLAAPDGGAGAGVGVRGNDDRRAARRRVWPMIAVAAAFWLLALSNRVLFSNVHLFTVPLPDALLRALSVFRSSGRFGWIAFYLINLAVLGAVVRRLPARAATAVLLAALALQIGDQSAKYREFRAFIGKRAAWHTPLQSPEWASFAAGAKRLIIVPPHPAMVDIYLPFADLAARHRLATNAAYIARDGEQGAAFAQDISGQLARGEPEADTLHVFAGREALAPLPPQLAAQVRELDGYFVLPPGRHAP